MQEITIQKMPEYDYYGKEAFNTLRTNVQFSGENVRVLAITSCTPGDGKSSVSLQLAASFSEIGKKVLFIDADMRKSVLVGRHKIIAKSAKGLAHYLSGQEEIEQILCKTNIPNLFFILAGPIPPNPSELLSSRLFKKMIEEQRKEFDYIIVDTPPLGSVIDSAIVSKECDGVALVISSNTVSYKFAQKVKEQLETTGCKILGVIMNKVKKKNNGYYGKYYGKYYG